MSRLQFLVALWLAVCSLAGLAAEAGPCRSDAEHIRQHPRGYDGVLAALASPSCLGDPTNDGASTLVQAFGQATPDLERKAIERMVASQAAMGLLVDAARRPADASEAEGWAALGRELVAMQQRLTSVAPDAGIPRKPWGDGLDADADGAVSWDGREFKLLAPTGCARDATSCPVFRARVEMVRIVNLVGRLRSYMQADNLARFHADAQLAVKRWDTYRTGARHQYIWEVWANGKRMGDSLCPKDPGTGIQQGFCAVPTSQWVLLHPEAALAFNAKAQKSSELNAALVVELVGYHRWQWAAADSAQMRGRLGVSLAAAYTQHGDGRRWGYGPAFTFGDGYNLAVTRAAGGQWSVLVNIALGDRYFGRKQEFVDYLKKVEKPDLTSLF